MHLGGASVDGTCSVTCDFFGSSNWRIEKDAQGCSIWRYDTGGACAGDGSPFCVDGAARI
jgi:hypothetical protein